MTVYGQCQCVATACLAKPEGSVPDQSQYQAARGDAKARRERHLAHRPLLVVGRMTGQEINETRHPWQVWGRQGFEEGHMTEAIFW